MSLALYLLYTISVMSSVFAIMFPSDKNAVCYAVEYLTQASLVLAFLWQPVVTVLKWEKQNVITS